MTTRIVKIVIAILGLWSFAMPVNAEVFPVASQWFYDGSGNITQFKANTPIKITGVSTGSCLTLNGSGILTTTTCGSGGSIFPFTPFTNYNATSTTLGLLNGFFTSASSTFSTLGTGATYTQNGLLLSHATTSTSVAYQDVWRDGNGNAFANNFVNALTTKSADGGTVVLTPASTRYQMLTGSNSETYQMPNGNASGMNTGATWEFNNNTGNGFNITVTTHGGATIATVPYGGYVRIILTDNGTSEGLWEEHPLLDHRDVAGHYTTGLGSTTPFARLSLQLNNGDTEQYGLVIGSSTQSATTTLFSIDNTGAASTTSFFGAMLTPCTGTNALTWTGGKFSCTAQPQGTVTSVTATAPVFSSGGATPNITWFGLSTTSQPASSNVLVSNGSNGVYGAATSSETCSGVVSCTAHTVLSGGGAITITGGSPGQVLGWLNGAPTWTASSSVAAGTAISISTNGAVTTVNNTGVTSLTAGAGISLSGSTGAVTVTNAYGYPFTPSTFGTAVSATSTTLLAAGGVFGSSTMGTIVASSSITNQSVKSAIVLNSATGLEGAYGGTSCTNQFPRSLNASGAATCATVANTDLANSTISGVALGSNLNSLSVSNSLTGTSYNGSAAISDWKINPAFSNWFNATQNFTNASTSQFTATSSVWFTSLSSVPLYVDANGKLGSAGSGVSGNCIKWGANNTLVDAGAACGSGSGSGGTLAAETPTGSINGSNTSFTTVNPPVEVFLNGVLQDAGGVNITISGTTITFVNAPPTGSTLTSYYATNLTGVFSYPFFNGTFGSLTTSATTTPLMDWAGGVFGSTSVSSISATSSATVYGTTSVAQAGGALLVGTSTDLWQGSSPALNIDMRNLPGSTEGFDVTGNLNNFLEGNCQNLSTGVNAQCGFSATRNDGTATTNFIWMGINNTGFNTVASSNIGNQGDGTILSDANDFWIGNGTSGKNTYFTTGGVATSSIHLAIDSNGNVTVGTSTSFAQFGVSALFGTTPPNNQIFAVSSSSQTATTTILAVNTAGHLITSGTAPTVQTNACGTSPSITGNDIAGKITTGSASPLSCAYNFARPYTTAPACTISGAPPSGNKAFGALVSSTTATSFSFMASGTVAALLPMTSWVVSYICIGTQ